MTQQQPQGYEAIGFNRFLERNPQTYGANDTINNFVSPFLSQFSNNGLIFDPFSDFTPQTFNSVLQPISADNIQGGVIQSNNGNLTLDLNNGTLNYNDGAVNLFELGGISSNGNNNNLTINNTSNNTLLSTDSSSVASNGAVTSTPGVVGG